MFERGKGGRCEPLVAGSKLVDCCFTTGELLFVLLPDELWSTKLWYNNYKLFYYVGLSFSCNCSTLPSSCCPAASCALQKQVLQRFKQAN